MKTIGLIGGMSWESTAEYYRLINEGVQARLGGLHSAKILLSSIDFAPMEEHQRAGRWDEAGEEMVEIGRTLEAAGADCILICANTMHLSAPALEGALNIPLLHIADAAGEAIKRAGFTRAGLLGTKFTMEMDFYSARLKQKHGIETVIPDKSGREAVNGIIYNELCRGIIRRESKELFIEAVDDLAGRGAEGVILGCTEIPLLIGEKDITIPAFDTTALHAEAAAAFALE